MQITIDTNNLSELDINMLAFLADQGETEPASDPEPEVETPKTTTKKAPKPEPAEEDLLGNAEPPVADDAPTMSDAVAAATQLVSSGSAAKVKTALSGLDVKRVSELTEEQIPAFLAALK